VVRIHPPQQFATISAFSELAEATKHLIGNQVTLAEALFWAFWDCAELQVHLTA
jgi:hypothetical protein